MNKSILKLTIAIALATTAFAANAASYTLFNEKYTLLTETNSLLNFGVVDEYKTPLTLNQNTNGLELSLQNPLPTADGKTNIQQSNPYTWFVSEGGVINTYNFTMTTTASDQLFGTFTINLTSISSSASLETITYKADSIFTGGTGLFANASGTGSFEILTKESFTPNRLFTEVGSLNARITTPVAAIPEADTSAMLLMGAGIMGFIARRRKNTNA